MMSYEIIYKYLNYSLYLRTHSSIHTSIHLSIYFSNYLIVHSFIIYFPSVSPDVRDAYFGSLDKAFVGFTFIDDSAPVNKMMSGSVR